MKKYEYKVVLLKVDRVWTGKAEADYLQIINEYSEQGWRFVSFVPAILNPKGSKGQEMLFERKLTDQDQ